MLANNFRVSVHSMHDIMEFLTQMLKVELIQMRNK